MTYKKGTDESTESPEGSTQRLDFKMSDEEATAYQIEYITPDIIASLQRHFKDKAEEYEMAANMCSELANLSTMLKGPALKVVLQNTFLASPIQLTCPLEIFKELKSTTEEQQEVSKEEKLKQIFQTCFPHPLRLKDENDITRPLAALVYFINK